MIHLQQSLFPWDSIITDEDLLNDNNFTPHYAVEPFRELVKDFHLDPFSCLRANQIIQAQTFWTKADDAFSKDWSQYQNKWVNPPYSKGNIERAVEMVLTYAHIGNTFLLTNSNTSSNWYLDAQNYSVCYLTFNHRLEFTNPKNDGKKKKSGNDSSQTLFYFGKLTAKRFKASCEHLGNVSVTI